MEIASEQPSSSSARIDRPEPSLPVKRPGWRLWALWLAAVTVGSFLGQAVWLVLPEDGLFYYLFAITPALIGAFFSWLVLRRCIMGFSLRSWVGVSVLGSIMSAVLSQLLGLLIFANFASGSPFTLTEIFAFS